MRVQHPFSELDDGNSEGDATTKRPPPRRQPPRHADPTKTTSKWRARPQVVSSYDPFNQHVPLEEELFASRSYFGQGEDKPRSGSFYFPL